MICNYDKGHEELGVVFNRDRGIPLVGEISRVLFNLVLMEIFDKEFKKEFPEVVFYRFINEVFILSCYNGDVVFCEDSGNAFLKKVRLEGEIVSIGVRDDPIPCYKKHIYFDRKNRLELEKVIAKEVHSDRGNLFWVV